MKTSSSLRPSRVRLASWSSTTIAPVVDDHDLVADLRTSERMWVERTIVRLPPSVRMSGSISRIWPRVEPDGGLVEDQHRGLVDERLRQADALAIALGEVPEQAPGDRREAAGLEHALDRRADVAARRCP